MKRNPTPEQHLERGKRHLEEAQVASDRHDYTTALSFAARAQQDFADAIVDPRRPDPAVKSLFNRAAKVYAEAVQGLGKTRNPAESPADIIARQLGGTNRLRMFLGSKRIYSANDGKTLLFDYKPQYPSKQGNICEITYNRGTDLYDITFMHIGTARSGFKKTVIKQFDGIYADQLMDLFEGVTGLYLTLKPRR